MAAITNYGTLKTEVAAYSHRTDLTAEIPGFIQIAETQVNNDLRVPEMVVNADLTIADITGQYALPTTFLEMRSITGNDSTGTRRPLKPHGIDNIFRLPSSLTPQAFAVWNNKILIRGIPAINDVFTMIYWERPTAFSADGDTSDLLTRFPTVYLYAALVELHTWTQDDEFVALAATRYDSAIRAFNLAGMEKRQNPTVAPAFNYGNYSTSTY